MSVRSILAPHLLAALFAASVIAPDAAASSHFHDRASKPQGYLGINFRDVPEDQFALLKLKDAHGEEVILVDHDGPACASGLKEHDVLLQLNGQPIDSEDQLRRSLRDMPAGRRLSFTISRDGQPQTVTIQLANRDTVGQQAWDRHMTVPDPAYGPDPAAHTRGLFGANAPTTADLPHRSLFGATLLSASYTGALLELMSPQLAGYFGAPTGLLVRAVDPDSPAAIAGMRAGDVVTQVNALPVVNGADWLRPIHANRGKPLPIVVLRDKKEQTLTLIPDSKKRSSFVLAHPLLAPPDAPQLATAPPPPAPPLR